MSKLSRHGYVIRKKNHTVISYDLSEGCDILNKNQLETYCKDYKPNCIIHLAN